MSKKIVSTLMALVMALSLLPVQVLAAGADYTTGEDTAVRKTVRMQTAGSADITGTGGADDPYLIYTAAGLKAFRDAVNGGHGGAHAKLMNDIVLNDGTFDENGNWSEGGTPDQWTPIGNSYCGTFDGQGKTIKGLYVKDAGYAGLFGNVYQGTVKNVAVTGYVEGTEHVGGIAGYAGNSASITGCTNAATVKGGSSSVGGIVGYLFWGGTVRSCTNLGSVWAQIDSDQGMAEVGGIAGCLFQRETIADCYNAGSIAIEDSGTGEYGASYLGGIAGSATAMEPNYVSNCYSVGSLTYRGSASAVIRGIAGDASRCFVTNCYWLEGTAESGIGGDPMSNSSAAKSKADFANGTVLNALKNGDENSPWTKCGYLSAAGMIVPLLKGQTADTFDIYTAEDLKTFRDMVNGGGSTLCGRLMNDIVLNDGTFDKDGNYTKGAGGADAEKWTPISSYSGTFDGDGYTIRGLYVVRDKFGQQSYIGLFSSVQGGTVKNVAVAGYVAVSDSMPGTAGGIAGEVYGGTVESCVNLCHVVTDISSAGGITGIAIFSSTITNCANLGEISGGIDGAEQTGGVVGALWYDSTMTNCYNAGRVTNGGGIVGSTDDDKVVNSYYLTGTAEKAAIKGNADNTAAAKSKSDFANGAVLGLLKNGDENSPWTKSGYVAAAKMTLPLLDRQTADSHDHDFAWKYSDTEHWRECACGVIEANSRAAHSGGTATCIAKAECAACGAAYGGLAGHSFTAENTDAQYLKTAATCTAAAVYYKSCAVCGEKGTDTFTSGGPKGHSWGAWASNGNDTHTRRCTIAGCTASETASCSGGTATCSHKARCAVCGGEYGGLNAKRHELKHVAAKAPGTYVRGNTEYWQCTGCGKYFADADGRLEIREADIIIYPTGKGSGDAGSKTSPGTFDAGIGICGVTAVTSLAGLALLRRKRRDGE